MSLRPFHLAIAVDDLPSARAFYGGALGCPEGRSSERWVDFSLEGHQLVVHLVDGPVGDRASQRVDGHGVPVPHFGLVLTMARWRQLADRLAAHGVQFALEPQVRFAGLPGEQATFFVRDPAGNALEFKGFADDAQLFAT